MTRYSHRGNKADWESYQASFEHVAKISKKGSELRAKMAEVEDAIAKGQENFDKADREVMQLKKQLANAEAIRTSIEEINATHRKERTELIEHTEQVTDEFEKAKQRRNKSKEIYLHSIPTVPRKGIDAPNITGPTNGLLDIFTLGDVHGWAPGLANYIVEHNLAEITINGMPYEKNANKIFPDVDELAVKGRPMEGQWMDGNPFTPFHLKNRNENYRGAFGEIEVHPGKGLDNGFFLQVGDLNDRGDYSELNFDIMRQLTLTSGGRALALLGNHEEMLLSGNYKNWLNNEEQSGFFDSKNNPGSVRLRHEFLGIKSDAVEAYRQSLFFSYCAHFAHLLLTQEYVLRSMLDGPSRERYAKLTQPALNIGNITEDKLERIAKERSWATLELCQKWLQNVWKSEKELIIPGAVVVFSIGNMIGLHASVNSLQKFFDSKRVEGFLNPYTTKLGANIRLHMYTSIPKSKSPDAEMLWERDNKGWTTSKASKKMVETVKSLQEKIPHVSAYVQGHEPLSGKEMRVKTHSIPTAFGEVNITNLDIGMTPVYLPAKMENKYSHTRTPDGLKIPTMGRDPVRFDSDYTASEGMTVMPSYESRSKPYRVVVLDRAGKPLVEVTKNPNGRLSMRCLEHGFLISVHQGGRHNAGTKVDFDATKPAGTRVYRTTRGFWGNKKYTIIGDVMFKSGVQLENDPIMLQAKRDEEEAKRRAEEEAQRKAEEEAQRKAAAKAKRKAEEEAAAKKKAEEAEARKKAEEEAAAEAKKKVEAAEKAEEVAPTRNEAAEPGKKIDGPAPAPLSPSTATSPQAPTRMPPATPPSIDGDATDHTPSETPKGPAKDVPAAPLLPDPSTVSPSAHAPEETTTGQQNGTSTSHGESPAPPASQQRAPPPPADGLSTPPQPVRKKTPPNPTSGGKTITIFVDALNPREVHHMLTVLRKVSKDEIKYIIHGKRQPKLGKKYPGSTSHEPDLKKYKKIMLTTSGSVIHLTKEPIKAQAKYHALEIEDGKKLRKSFQKELVELIEKLEGEL